MTPAKAKMAAVLCGLSMAGAGVLSGGMHILDASHVSAAAVQTQASPTSGTGTGSQNQTTNPATAQPKITIEKALEIARGQVQGDVRELELETDNGVLTYKVKLGNAKVYINAEDGSVLQVKTKDTSESFPAAKITVEKAIEIAKGQAQGDFKEAELDMEGGSLVWEVEIGNSEISIDAEDGTVLRVADKSADHEGDENDSDHGDENENDSNQGDENSADQGDENANDSASTAGSTAALYTVIGR